MEKKSTVSAMLTLKCPQCHEGNLFAETNPFVLKKMTLMPEVCPVCKLNFNPEPGFYWGALYTSYALAVGMSLAVFVVMYFIWGWLVWPFLLINTLLLIFLAPVLLRYSRVLWIYINFKFFRNSWKN
jgi:uncharacterized protein (DUF983 family)